MATDYSILLSTVPDAILRNLRHEAEQDAHYVIKLLDVLGIHCSTKKGDALCLPADFLLDLGAWARLLRWEMLGITRHLDAGIGSAEQVLMDAFRRLAQPEQTQNVELPSRWAQLIHLSAKRMACSGQELLSTEVLLSGADSADDTMLDSLAQFLWQNRHHGRPNEN